MARRTGPEVLYAESFLTVLAGPGDSFSVQVLGMEPLAIITREQAITLATKLLASAGAKVVLAGVAIPQGRVPGIPARHLPRRSPARGRQPKQARRSTTGNTPRRP